MTYDLRPGRSNTIHTQRGGFDVSIYCDVDQYYTPDYLGRFVSKWEPGALNHHRKLCHNVRDRECQWYVPETSVEDHRKSLHDMGYSKAEADRLARSYAEQDYRRAATFGEEWCVLAVYVTVRRLDVKLAHAINTGIESDCDQSEKDAVVEEMVETCVRDARKKLRELVDTVSALEQLARGA